MNLVAYVCTPNSPCGCQKWSTAWQASCKVSTLFYRELALSANDIMYCFHRIAVLMIDHVNHEQKHRLMSISHAEAAGMDVYNVNKIGASLLNASLIPSALKMTFDLASQFQASMYGLGTKMRIAFRS
jgi:hypothetical protein